MTIPPEPKNCCCCKNGSVIPKLLNTTLVRPPGDTGGTHYTSPPFPRNNTVEYDHNHGAGACAASPSGSCGDWLMAGDLNGVYTHVIQNTVSDILGGGLDHNDYTSSGNVDLRAPIYGGKWLFAQKFWNGFFGLTSTDSCSPPDPTQSPDQIKYLGRVVSCKMDFGLSYHQKTTTWYTGTTTLYSVSDSTEDYIGSGEHTQSASISARTGITTLNSDVNTSTLRHKTRSFQIYPAGPDYDISDTDATDYSLGYIAKFRDSFSSWGVGCGGATLNFGQTAGNLYGFSGTPAAIATAIAALPFYPQVMSGSMAPYTYSIDSFLVSNTQLRVVISLVPGGNSTFLQYNYYISPGLYVDRLDEGFPSGTITFTLDVSLTDGYTSASCYSHFMEALSKWDLGDANAYPFRTDEQLANAPLVVFDEVLNTGLSYYPPTMNDYGVGLINDSYGNAPGSLSTSPGQQPTGAPVDYITTWAQRKWLDPEDYIWLWPDNTYSNDAAATSGATLITPLYTGQVISHTQAGSERHFWFKYASRQRLFTPPLAGGNGYQWFYNQNGGFSLSPLPKTAMRWMNNDQAQYDPGAYREGAATPPGNYPQAFMNQNGDGIVGGAYVRATQPWPSVNYARPCGPDKYAVDQPTVCCITTNAAPVFTVDVTGNAIAPLTAGGLAANDYVLVENDGIYQISSITGGGPWTINCGARIDTLPTGYVMSPDTDGSDHIGRLRWPTSSGICGRAAIATSFAGGTVTITPSSSLPYLRIDPTTNTILVDIYDGSMTLLQSSAALTRVSDTSFTCTHAAMPTAAFMTGAGVDWTKFNSTPRRTAVYLEWAFDQRAGALPTPPATWYAGIYGCTGGSVTQFTYAAGACPSVVGIVPYVSPVIDRTGPIGRAGSSPSGVPSSSFSNQVMFGFPAVFRFDGSYGSHWQAAIETTMVDPFWQEPFKPNCGGLIFNWVEDNGNGNANDDTSYPKLHFFAHHPWVEAASIVPTGMSLPGGITLFFDPSDQIKPPAYVYSTGGIPIGDENGNYGSVEQPWGFKSRACAATRFAADYAKFVTCP